MPARPIGFFTELAHGDVAVSVAPRGSEAQVHLADDEPGAAEVDAVVVPVLVALALEVEAIERVAAGDVEADMFEVEAYAGEKPHLTVEELVCLVVAVGAIEVVAVPLESAIGAQRLEDLP